MHPNESRHHIEGESITYRYGKLHLDWVLDISHSDQGTCGTEYRLPSRPEIDPKGKNFVPHR
jgi:hypothetical protein